jgi:hypothetical protein
VASKERRLKVEKHIIDDDATALDEHMAAALAQVMLDNPASLLPVCYDLDATPDDGPLPDSALGLLKAALPLVFARLVRLRKLPYRWRPFYLAPLKDGTWMPLNGNCTPLGYEDMRPYAPLPLYAHLTWEFTHGFDPRTLKGVWSSRPGVGGGRRHGWNGKWLEFSTRNYGANIGRVVAETKDPLRCATMLFTPPPPSPEPLTQEALEDLAA